nr:uncharacterized mitochondrial protein AtMg00810-like [Tanacetum cinerariifolium]
MTLIKAARTMLADSFLPNTFWAEAVSTACYVLNRVLVIKPQNKTPYELLTASYYKNKANHTTGPKETNNSAGTQDDFDTGNSNIEDNHAQEYYVLPLWSSYTSTVKRSKAKNGDEKLNANIDSKTNELSVDKEDQAFLEELERLKGQEKEATDAVDTLRKMFTQSIEDLLLQAGAARANSTNFVNTATTPLNAIGTKWVYSNKKDERGMVVRNKESVKTASTPIETKKPLVKDEEAADVSSHSKNFTSSSVKRIFRHLKGQPKLGLWYPKELAFNLEAYPNSYYARANLDRKSTTGGCQFLSRRLISWQCKKQTIIATSTTEAEYVAAGRTRLICSRVVVQFIELFNRWAVIAMVIIWDSFCSLE